MYLLHAHVCVSEDWFRIDEYEGVCVCVIFAGLACICLSEVWGEHCVTECPPAGTCLQRARLVTPMHPSSIPPPLFLPFPSASMQLSQDLTRLKEHYEKKMKDLMANAVGTVELQQLKHKHEQKVNLLWLLW